MDMKSTEMLVDSNSDLVYALTSQLHDGKYKGKNLIEVLKEINRLPFNGVDIYFNDYCWNFAPYFKGVLPIHDTYYTIYFDYSSSYCDLIKAYVFFDIVKGRRKIVTVTKDFYLINTILLEFEKDGFVFFGAVPLYEYEKVFQSFETRGLSYMTITSYRSIFKNFLRFYEKFWGPVSDSKAIRDFLNSVDRNKINKLKESQKYPEIPEENLEKIKNFCLKLMHDETCELDDRIMAASIIVYIKTGMRTSELFTVTTDALKFKYSDLFKKRLYYLHFLSYKAAKGDNNAFLARCIVDEEMIDAYNLLVDLCKAERERRKSRKLVYFYTFSKKREPDEFSFGKKYRIFFLHYCRELDLLNRTDLMDVLRDKAANTIIKNPAKHYPWLKDDDIIYYPCITQYRVSMCNRLNRQHVPIPIIQNNMNHLTAEMTDHYMREDAQSKKDISQKVYNAVYRENATLMGKNVPAMMESVDAFIAGQKFNIAEDLDSVIAACSKKYPMIAKTGGICIRCGSVLPCSRNKITDELYCAFGKCPNSAHMFFNAAVSYKECADLAVLIQVNYDNHKIKQAKMEIKKLGVYLYDSLLPELAELDKQLKARSKDEIKEEYPELSEIIDNREKVEEDVTKWMKIIKQKS